MSHYYTKYISLIIIIVFIVGCSHNNAVTASDADIPQETNSLYVSPPFKLPVFLVGNASSKKNITFIWSYDCTKCRASFREIFDVFVRARDKKDIALIMIQYEDRPDVIKDKVTPAVCSGSKMYQMYMWQYLLRGLNFDQTKSLKNLGDITPETCGVDALTTQHDIEAFFNALREQVGDSITTRPVIVAGGEIIKTTRELRAKIGAMDRTNPR